MFRILLKKELEAKLSGFMRNRKNGKYRSGGALVGYIILMLFVAVSIAFSLFALMLMLAKPLISGGYDELFFGVTGGMLSIFGLIGGMFTTYATLFVAKDNEMLLTLPVKPVTILLSRMVSTYLLLLYYTLPPFLPIAGLYFFYKGVNAASLICAPLAYFMLTLCLMTVSCLLGWFLAVLAARFNSKKLVTVVSIIVSMGAYYLFYFQRQKLFDGILEDPAKKNEQLKKWLYPLYVYGKASSGDWLATLLFSLVSVAAISLLIFIMARSYTSIVTSKRGGRVKKYVEKEYKARSATAAMSARELRKFLLEPGYVINAGFGSFMMIALGVAAIVKGGDLLKAVGEMFVDAPAGTDFVQRFTAPAAVAVTLLMSSMTTVSILSVSTDGNTYWLLQSSPVTSRQVFLSKITPHLLFNVIPGEFLCIAGCIAFRAGLLQSLIAVIMVFLYSYVTAAIGYVIDIKRPKLDWTDITVAIKQNVNVLIAMAAGFVLALIAGGLGFVLSIFIHPALALLIASIPLIALAVAFKFIGSNCWKPAQNN